MGPKLNCVIIFSAVFLDFLVGHVWGFSQWDDIGLGDLGLGDLDLGDLGLGDLGLGDLGLDDLGLDDPGSADLGGSDLGLDGFFDNLGPPPSCFKCESDTFDSADPCVTPSQATVNVTQCEEPGLWSTDVPQCTWVKVKSITPDAVDPEINHELYKVIRDCAPTPQNPDLFDVCGKGDEHLALFDQFNFNIKDVIGGDETSTYEVEGCFCTSDHCNALSMAVPPATSLLVAWAAAMYALAY